MSTSRSALELLREEPLLAGVVLYLIATGHLVAASDFRGVPLWMVSRFSGLSEDDLRDPSRGPVISRWNANCSEWVSRTDLDAWLSRLSSDRSDFAPAIPRALPGGRVA